jgi:hypothetical protein
MKRLAKVFQKYIDQQTTLPRFLEQLELEKERAWSDLRLWWRSTEAFDTVWDDLGGFDEVEFERRVSDAFYIGYSSIVRRSLDPIFKRPTNEFPELAHVIKKVEPLLLSDIRERLRHAETIEEVYYCLGDDHTHWLVAYLVDHLKAAPAKPSTAH